MQVWRMFSDTSTSELERAKLGTAEMMNSEYKDAIEIMLQVLSLHDLLLFRNARLTQMIFHQMSEPVKGYSGIYQGSGSVWDLSRCIVIESLHASFGSHKKYVGI